MRLLRCASDAALVCALAWLLNLLPAGSLYSLFMIFFVTGTGGFVLIRMIERFNTRFLPPVLHDLSLSTFDSRDFALGVWGAAVATRERPYSLTRPDPLLVLLLALVPPLGFLRSDLPVLGFIFGLAFQLGVGGDRVWCALGSAVEQFRNQRLQLLSRKEPMAYYSEILPGCIGAAVLIPIGGALIWGVFLGIYAVAQGTVDGFVMSITSGESDEVVRPFATTLAVGVGSVVIAGGGGWVAGRIRSRVAAGHAEQNQIKLHEAAEKYWDLLVRYERAGTK